MILYSLYSLSVILDTSANYLIYLSMILTGVFCGVENTDFIIYNYLKLQLIEFSPELKSSLDI